MCSCCTWAGRRPASSNWTAGSPARCASAASGLLPEFRGRHLGKWFLGLAVEAAWDFRPERVWTSVGDADDPRAILLYQWAGFVPYETTREGGPARRGLEGTRTGSPHGRMPPDPRPAYGEGRRAMAHT